MTLGCLAAVVALAPARWETNSHRAVVFDGKPYIPVGVEVDAKPEAIAKATAAGIGDLSVTFSADGSGWAPALEALTASGARFVARFDDPWPSASAIVVAPQCLRRESPPTGDLVVEIPGASEVFAVLASTRDRSVRWSQSIGGMNGRFVLPLGSEGGDGRVLLLYPHFEHTSVPDVFERFDARRDTLLTALRKHPLGSPCRGVINALGERSTQLPAGFHGFPTSHLFRFELASYLQRKYSAVGTALRAWGVATNDVESFEALSRLLPLWSSGRGVSALRDLESDRIYVAEDSRSAAWTDIERCYEAISAARARSFVDLLEAAVDVPVFESEVGIGHGTSLSPVGEDPVAQFDSLASSLARSMQAETPTATWATGLSCGAMSPAQTWEGLRSVGVRGAFFVARTAQDLAAVKAVELDASDAEWSLQVLRYPIGADQPTGASRLGGGTLWLPGPAKSLPFGSGFNAYQTNDAKGTVFVVWSDDVRPKTPMRWVKNDSLSVATFDGAEVRVKRGKKSIEIDLGPDPIFVRGIETCPVPEVLIAQRSAEVTVLLDDFGRWIDVGNAELIRFRETLKAIDLDPALALDALDAQSRRLGAAAAPYVWISMDRPDTGNLGAAVAAVGSASMRVLSATSGFPGQLNPSVGSWSIRSKASAPHDIWIAMKPLGGGELPEITVTIGGEPRLVDPTPLERYGDGFAWYRAGSANLGVGPSPVALSIRSETPQTVLIDLFVATPVPFAPEGSRPPLNFLSKSAPQRPKTNQAKPTKPAAAPGV